MSYQDPNQLTSDGRTFRQWTALELRYLRLNYRDVPNCDLALLLGKTEKAVLSKASRLGLRKGSKRLTAVGYENISKRKDRRDRREAQPSVRVAG